MGEHQSEQMNSRIRSLSGRMLFVGAILVFLGLVLFSDPGSTSAGLIKIEAYQALQAENDVYLPIIYREVPSAPVNTPTSTATSTGTPTVTGTPPTATPTLTGTPPTSTPTGTPTTTGTPATSTPTATGTIVANARVDIIVSPFQGNVGERFTFTIEVTNNGTAPAENALVTDSFPDYMDVESVTTSKGTASRAIHSISVIIGTVSPGEKVTITIVARANNRKLTTETVSNTVTLQYESNGIKTTTDSVSYRIVVSTLPGTGDLPLDWQDASDDRLLNIQVVLMGGLGVLLTGLGIWAWKRDSNNRYWLLGIGFILLVVSSATLFAEMQNQLAASDLGLLQPIGSSSAPGDSDQAPFVSEPTPSQQVRPPAYLFATPEQTIIETLPSYPIPTPDFTFTPVPEIEQPDTSAVERIIIPAILLDTEVKYVPFDGFTWLIRGLRHEIAWLGDTSWPGLGGNTVLAGHVTVSGIGNGPFRKLEELGDGEFIFLHTEENTYTYRVRSRSVVESWDLSVVEPSASPQITLITCVEWDEEEEIYLKRLVLYADLVRVDSVLQGSSY